MIQFPGVVMEYMNGESPGSSRWQTSVQESQQSRQGSSSGFESIEKLCGGSSLKLSPVTLPLSLPLISSYAMPPSEVPGCSGTKQTQLISEAQDGWSKGPHLSSESDHFVSTPDSDSRNPPCPGGSSSIMRSESFDASPMSAFPPGQGPFSIGFLPLITSPTRSAFAPPLVTSSGPQTPTERELAILRGMSLFTVEQLELIRRLRCTGITAEAVLEAFRTLEQIESDLDQARAQSAALAALIGPTKMSSEPHTPQIREETQSPVLLQHLRAQPPVPVTISASSPALCSSPERLTVQTVPLASTANEQSIMQGYESSSSGCRPIRSQRTPMREITTLDDPTELDEFMIQGEEGCINDMKQFITQYSLRQTTVAMMTGVSQPYISKLLNGNHRELSLRCRKNIYSWYLNCRRHPEKLSAFLADPSTRLETNGDGELVPQRRERYVFRPILIRMLEGFFAQTPFPDLNRRIEIATACNHALQLDKKGVGLMPKEVVSPQVVANWFANKRKELRRKSNEEQQAASHPQMIAGQLMPGSILMPERLENVSRETASCSDAGESTPSPIPDENSTDEPKMNAIDMAALASRLGFQLPVSLSSSMSIEETPPPVSIATLASQLLQQSFPCLPMPDQELPMPLHVPTSLALLRPEVSQMQMPSQEDMLSALYPSSLHSQLLKMEQTAE